MMLQVKELLNRTSAQGANGQTLIEYALIVLLFSIAAIVVLGLLGGDINNAFTTIITTFLGATGT